MPPTPLATGVLLSLSALAVAAPPPAASAPVSPAPSPAPAAPRMKVGWQEALDRALARNPSVVIARQEIARADALVRQVRAAGRPTLTAGGTYTRLDAERSLNDTVVTPANQWAGNILFSVPLLAARAWADESHAQDNREVVAVTAADVRRQIAASVGRAYLAVLLQHRQIEVAIRARDTATAHYQYAHTRLTGGLGNSIDDARAEQELRSDEAQVGTAQAGLVRAQSALAILLSEEQLVDVSEDVVLATGPDPQAALDEARKNRTDVRAAEARLVASQRLRKDAWVYYMPSLLATIQGFAQRGNPLQPAQGWQAQLVLSIPLYDGGFRYGVARERRALEAESVAQQEATLRQASVEVRAAFEVLQRADESLHAAQAAAKAAGNAAGLADQAYRAGATTNLEVIDAERRARDAATLAVLAEDAARQARLDLLLASGRFP